MICLRGIDGCLAVRPLRNRVYARVRHCQYSESRSLSPFRVFLCVLGVLFGYNTWSWIGPSIDPRTVRGGVRDVGYMIVRRTSPARAEKPGILRAWINARNVRVARFCGTFTNR